MWQCRAHSRASKDLFCIVGDHQIGQDVTLLLSNTNPLPRLFRALRWKFVVDSIIDFLPPMKLKKRRDIWLLVEGNFNGSLPVQGFQSQMVKKADEKQSAEEPIDSRSTSAIQDAIDHAFDLANLLFSIILVLLVGLRLAIINTVHTQRSFMRLPISDFALSLTNFLGAPASRRKSSKVAETWPSSDIG